MAEAARRIDPRAGVAMVWGRVAAGQAPNAIPSRGELAGTFRCLDSSVWTRAGALIGDAVREIVMPYGVRAEIQHVRGVPPTVNDADAVEVAEAAVRTELGEDSVQLTPQSLGGEDFAWMLEARRHGPARHPHPRRPHLRPAPAGLPAGRAGVAAGRPGTGRDRRARPVAALSNDPRPTLPEHDVTRCSKNGHDVTPCPTKWRGGQELAHRITVRIPIAAVNGGGTAKR